MTFTSFRNVFLPEAETRLSAVDLAGASINQLLAHGALYKMAAEVAAVDMISPYAVRLLETMSGPQLETWIADPSNRESFERILASTEAVKALCASSTIMATIAGSDTAVAALLENSNAMAIVFTRSTAMVALVASTVFMTGVTTSSSYMASIFNSSAALNAIFAASPAKATFKASTALTAAAIPTMTTNSAPSGTASASSIASGSNDAYKAFDKTATHWLTVSGSPSNQWVKYDFGAAVFIHSLAIDNTQSAANRSSKDIRLEYSDDNTTWATAVTTTLPNNTASNNYDVKVTGKHRYWRVYVINNYGDSSYSGLAEVQMTGFN